MSYPTFVKIVEVGPRDGLQNEEKYIPTPIKIEFINQLSSTGLSAIEVTSFVSPKKIPQLSDNKTVFLGIEKYPHISYSALIPNLQGLEDALSVGVREIAVFTTPSETFSEKNTHCTIAEGLVRISEILEIVKQKNIRVRGYLSCVLGCPYEGEIDPRRVSKMVKQLLEMGCDEISLGDTIGVGTPLKTKQLLEAVFEYSPVEKIAVHFHDTYGQALVNLMIALECGVAIVDSAISGLGGCPYAKGATGNVATEEVVYLLNGMGIKTGLDLMKLAAVGQYISSQLQRTSQSKVNRALFGLSQ